MTAAVSRESVVQVFEAEAHEHLARMEEALLSLEAGGPAPEILAELFRSAHTLKGGAVSLGFTAAGDLAHGLEDLLEHLRGGALRVTPDLVTLLLQTVDVLRRRAAEAVAGRDVADPEQRRLRERLAEFAARVGEAGSGGRDPLGTPEGPRREEAAERRSRTLRVGVETLDRLLDLAGEIAVARGRLQQRLEADGSAGALEAEREADRLFLELQELVLRARMVPLGPALRPHARTVRDLAAALGKQARLVIEGEALEVDTSIVEHLREALVHMIANALDHGIEPPARRQAAGKDPCATIRLRARRETGQVVVEVADDGAGLDRGRIAELARTAGLARDHDRLDDDDLTRLIFEPGFSTAERVTDVSGRGVGLDVVRRNVEALRGSVAVRSRDGEGAVFTVRLPLTLAIIDGFGVAVGGDVFVVPMDDVLECLELPRGCRLAADGRGVADLRREALPLLRLRDHLGLAGGPARESVLVVRHRRGRAGLVVDALLGKRQTVIKPLLRPLRGVPGVAASAVLGDGRVALVLDVAALLTEFGSRPRDRRSEGPRRDR